MRSFLIGFAALAACGAAHAQQECNTTSGKCKVDVLVFGTCPTTNIRFDPDTLRLAGRHNVEIIWSLPQGYAFCPGRNDGVKFKDASGNPDGQFYDPVYDDASGTCFLHFKWHNKNEPWTAQRPAYAYIVQFTSPTATTCTKDPFIKNG
jgi:hypothetical protein